MLTDRMIRQAMPPANLTDANGLRMKVVRLRSGATSRKWSVRFLTPDGRRCETGLGSFPEVSLAEARARASEIRMKARAGGDPLAERRAARGKKAAPMAPAPMTFGQAAEAYLNQHESQWSNKKHRQQWRKSLFDYAAALCPHPIAEIDTPAVLGVLDPIWTAKPETARRVRQRIEALLDWAMARGHRPQGGNPARLKGNLAYALPRVRALPEHHAALPSRDVSAFWQALQARQGAGADALKFALLTAARSGEVRGATWDEINFDAELWTVPGQRMKAEREHRVPLSAPALDLLRARRAAHGNEELVFGSDLRPSRQLSDMTLSAVMRRMNLEAVPHGLRSTFRTWAGETTAYPREVVEMALAHAVESKVEAAYFRGDLLEKRRRLMNDWARFVTEGLAAEGGNVMPIRGVA